MSGTWARGGPMSSGGSRSFSSLNKPSMAGPSTTTGAKGLYGAGGKVKTGGKRHRKIIRDTIKGITKGSIRRLARRGGIKRISATFYDEARAALKDRLETILRDCVLYVEYRKAKTITVEDVLHALRRLGKPIYGFDKETWDGGKKRIGANK